MKKLTRLFSFGLVSLVCLSAQNAYADDGEFRINYKPGGGLYIGDGNNLVHISARVQGRFTYTNLENAADTDSWTVQRGKVAIDGFTLDKKLNYKFQMNLATRARATTSTVCAPSAAGADVNLATGECASTATPVTAESTTGLAALEDFWVDYEPQRRFGIRVGQFKVPFLFQQLTSSGKQQFVDRALSTSFFDFAYDIGAAAHGKPWESNDIQWTVFAMNGDGVNTINRNQGLLVGARVDVPLLGTYDASESDIDNSAEPNFGFGLAYAFNEGASAFTNGQIPAGAKTSHGTADAGFKYKGWSTQTGLTINRSHEAARVTNWAYNQQVGYFFIPKKLELAAKAGGAIFTNATANQYEYAAAVNYFIKGHGLKLQTDYTLLLNTRGINLNDHRFRTQVQVIF